LGTLFWMGESAVLTGYQPAVLQNVGRINLDIEVGASRGYAAFVSRLRTLATGASKK